MLTNLTISKFMEALAAREPAPGGGSAAALAGLLGASLVAMAINLTRGQREYIAGEALLAEKQAEVTRLRAELLALVDRDADAFQAVVAAQGLPQGSAADRRVRDAAIDQAIKEAAEVPLMTARACLAVMEILGAILGRVTPHTVSDLGVSALASHTGLAGALFSTAINLPLLEDEKLVRVYGDEARRLRIAGDELLAGLQEEIYGIPTFAVLKP